MIHLNEKNIFLFDGAGALASAVLTGLLLPLFSDLLGLSVGLLYILAIFPLVYAVFSLSCYFIIKPQRSIFLKSIIFANIFYCWVSGSVVIFSPTITKLGMAILILESIVIFGVVMCERKVLVRHLKP